MSDDLVTLARRWSFWPATHYEGCEADHVGCLVIKLADQVERLSAERDKAKADLAQLFEDANVALDEAERLRAEVERLTQELEGQKAANQRLIRECDEDITSAKARAEEAIAERDTAQAERDTAQAEVERLTRAREALRDSLREALIERNDARYEAGQLRRDQSAQKLDMVANCKETLTSSRPDDETIWREALMLLLRDDSVTVEEAADQAQRVVDIYRARWPQ